MASNHETERGIGYPRLTREQIDLVIDALVWQTRQRELGKRLDLAEETITNLMGFYTRRWGLPPSIRGRLDEVPPLAKSQDQR